MHVEPTAHPEVLLVAPRVFDDPRGRFHEAYHAVRYAAAGIAAVFVQDNVSVSGRGVLRGLHYQLGRPPGKLVEVLDGVIFDVVVDLRRSSPRFGQAVAVRLAGETPRQLYVPPGFAHGFCVESERAIVRYKCTDYYAPAEERILRWDDPALGIAWPVADPLLSEKDRRGRSLAEAETYP